MKKLGIIGARGYAGGELLKLLREHSGFELAVVGSRQLEGDKVSAHFDYPSDLVIENLGPDAAAERDIDAWVMALPNNVAGPWTDAILARNPNAIIVDLSADHRFDDWTYGQPERFRETIRESTRIANPGCYATGAQLIVAPIVDLLDGPADVFGVSGYSGAGTTPSPKNDVDALADNLMPYKLTGHGHELEVTRHVGHTVNLMPHVAQFFRGISLTASMQIKEGVTKDDLLTRYEAFAMNEPLVRFEHDIPHVRDNANKNHVAIGGLSFDEGRRHAVVVATLDNLLKGAATQALQNLNLTCGFDELEGIQP